MFVFDAEESPDAPAKDFGEGDEEAEKSRMLQIVRKESVEDPVESK